MYQHRSVSRVTKILMLVGGILTTASLTGWSAGLFSESWKSKIKCVGNAVDGYDCEPVTSGSFKVKAPISVDIFGVVTIDPAQFTRDTDFDLIVGNAEFSGTLGDDPRYVAGGNKATILFTGTKCDKNGDNCKDVTIAKVSIKIATDGILVTASAKTGAAFNGDEGYDPIMANQFDGTDTGTIADTTPASFNIDSSSMNPLSASTTLTVTGSVTTKTVIDKNGDSQLVSSVKISGTP